MRSWLRLTDVWPGHIIGRRCYRWTKHPDQLSEQPWWIDVAGAEP